MAVPYLAGALRGWTGPIPVIRITQSVVNFQTVETETQITLDINKQPMPPQRVARRPEDQRGWKWWSLIVREGPLLSIDDRVIIDSVPYRIQDVYNWSESGFTKYEVHEDYGT